MAIITTLNNSNHIFKCNEAMNELYNKLKSCLNGDFTNQDYKNSLRIELKFGIFIILQTYNLKPYKDAFFETHKKYVDFQLTIKGEECFMIGDSKNFKIKKEYNNKRDLVIYHSQKKAHKILSQKDCLCIFFPHDVHAGGLKHKKLKGNKVFKVVAKVPQELLSNYFN